LLKVALDVDTEWARDIINFEKASNVELEILGGVTAE